MSSDRQRSNVQTFQRANVRTFPLAIKRLLDLLLSLAVLLLAWPVLLLIAVMVKLTSPGPVFFVQERVGLSERVYPIYKFRTMTDRPSGQSLTRWTAADEARITPIGHFLRDYGLDELPQIWNILKGDMSIIGPRPPLPAQVESYADHERVAFLMRPGVLSLAAVEGRRALPVERRIQLHVKYVEEWSIRLDLKILWQAIFVVLRRQNAIETLPE